MITCFYCANPVNPTEIGTCQYTAGWVKLREGGGGHGVMIPQRQSLFAHGTCVERQIAGWGRQMSLLDFPAVAPKPVEHVPTNAGFENGMLVHVCNVCGATAPFGIGVALRDGELGQWYCRAHLPVADELEG